MSTINTIPAYIDTFDVHKKELLNELYQFLKTIVPSETTETISYQMPTFRYNGNLIQFAMNKKHLGLYPGPSAITFFKDELLAYRTTKGAIQIPLDQPLPKELIKHIIDFNVSMLKDKTGPNWHVHKKKWTDEEEFMQQLIVKTNLEKTFKWGTDVYTFKGKNVVTWGGFKDFFSLWFYNGVFLSDPYQVLISASEGKTKVLRQWRFKKVQDMDEKKILRYINEAIQTVRDGKELVPEKQNVLQPEGILKEVLERYNLLTEAFNKLTKGKQREYIEYISEAKQEKTKVARLAKIELLILEGKGLNDKYKSK